MKPYVQYAFSCIPKSPLSEILTSELADLGFESFVETEFGLEAYLPKGEDDQNAVIGCLKTLSHLGEISYTRLEIAGQNWNALWEADYPKVEVGDTFRVRAPFHEPSSNADREVIISPKMSFGTGHHATTWLMLSLLLEMDITDAEVLDMGCGTGVLAIAAMKRGAKSATGIDIEDIAIDNTVENASLNNVIVAVEKGGVEAIRGTQYGVILANINKNILKADLPAYVHALKLDGTLLLSGFFDSDVEELQALGAIYGLKFETQKSKSDWAALKFVKSTL